MGLIVQKRPRGLDIELADHTMLDVSGRLWAEEPIDTYILKLRELDEAGDSHQVVLSSIGRTALLPIELQMLVVFHGWKSGKLDLVRLAMQNSSKQGPAIELNSEVEQFLLCHELRVSGQKEESLKILATLAAKSNAEIVQYRYVADFLEFGSLTDAFSKMNNLLPRLPQHRAAMIQFNFGVAALNQSLYSIVETTLSELQDPGSEIKMFFFNCLRVQFLAKKCQFVAALAPFKTALTIGQAIPSRSTDIAIVAANLLTSAFWAGDEQICNEAFDVIKRASEEKRNVLGVNRHVVLTAMSDMLRGNLQKSQRSLRSLFDHKNQLTRDHLNAAFLYLWSEVASGQPDVDLKVIDQLELKRDELAQSAEYYDFSLFKIVFRYLNRAITREELLSQIGHFASQKSHSIHGFHADWAHAITGCFHEDIYEGLLHILKHLRPFPILERIAILCIVPDDHRAHVGYWRICGQQVGDQTTRNLTTFRHGRLINDPQLIVKSISILKKFNGVSWLAYSCPDLELISALRVCKVLVNISSQKIVSIETQESLCSQPQVAQFFIFLLEQPRGIDKEALTLGLGWNNYDPAQHDPLIHNLVARLRAWLNKNAPDIEVHHSAKGWHFNSRELIAPLDTPREATTTLAPAIGQVAESQTVPRPALLNSVVTLTADNLTPATMPIKQTYVSNHERLHPRLEWILEQIKINKVITRAEVLAHFSVKKSTVVTDFNILLTKKLIRRSGSGRGVYYELQGAHP